MTDTVSDSLVILLHGYGSNGADLMGLADFWRTSLPNTVFASPNAPGTADGGRGFQWFSIANVTEANRTARLIAARESFDVLIGGIIEKAGFAERLDRVALIGFSQGTIMSLDALASGRWPVGAIIGFSGRLAPLDLLAPSLGTKLLLVHGDADRVIPFSESQQAADTLTAAGVAITLLVEPGVGHTISADGAGAALEFLHQAFD